MDANDKARLDAVKKAAAEQAGSKGNVAISAEVFCWLVQHTSAALERQPAAATEKASAQK
jgi:hypothetical protein